MISSDEFLYFMSSLEPDTQQPKIAKVIKLFDSGAVQVQFAGETAPAIKKYPYLSSYYPQLGDRVLMLPVAGSYVILDAINIPDATTDPSTDPIGQLQSPDFMRKVLLSSDLTNKMLGVTGFLKSVLAKDEFTEMLNRLENINVDILWQMAQGMSCVDCTNKTGEGNNVRYAPYIVPLGDVFQESLPDTNSIYFFEMGNKYAGPSNRSWTFFSNRGKTELTIYSDPTQIEPKTISSKSPYLLGRKITTINLSGSHNATLFTRDCYLNAKIFYY